MSYYAFIISFLFLYDVNINMVNIGNRSEITINFVSFCYLSILCINGSVFMLNFSFQFIRICNAHIHSTHMVCKNKTSAGC